MPGKAGRTTGKLYGADLVSGCVGSLFGTVLLILVLGIPITCMVIAMVSAASRLSLVR
jgi:hypothetical protein